MARVVSIRSVEAAFEKKGVLLAIADIVPLKFVGKGTKQSAKYLQIAASIREVGIVEPPMVAPDRSDPGKYMLLDGHSRIEVLKDMGETQVACLVSKDDEAFTYNRRISRISIVQEHKMILKAIEKGASEERIARALNVDVESIRRKRRLLEGICLEAVELLKDKHLPILAFGFLKKMAALRQIEAAHLMIAMNKYNLPYVKSLLAATPREQLVDSEAPKAIKGLTNEQLGLIERESQSVQREFRLAEQSYGTDHLDLVLTKGYLGALLANGRVRGYLAQHHGDFLREFQRIAEREATAA